MENQDLIIIEQLPIIKEQLKKVSEEIDIKVENAKKLVCTEENKQSIKKIRTEMNKELQEFETQRKNVKEKVLAPYMQFEQIYKECISEKYKSADKDLKEKIEAIEQQQKLDRENELKAFFYEKRSEHKNIDFITFENVGLNITLTASKISLERKVEEFIDKISSDLDLIDTQQNKDEILVEYKKDLNVSRAITEVAKRKEQMKQLEESRIAQNLEKEKQQFQNNLQQLANANTPTSQSVYEEVTRNTEKIYTITFKVTGTAPKLKQLKEYLIREGYQYE